LSPPLLRKLPPRPSLDFHAFGARELRTDQRAMHRSFVHVRRPLRIDLLRFVGGVGRNRHHVVSGRGLIRRFEFVACHVV